MSFFEEVDSTGIVEKHINDVLQLEIDQQKIILKSYRGIQQDLLNKLARTNRGTFTDVHLRGVLAQVQGAIGAIVETLNGNMIQGAKIVATKGIDHLIKELQLFDRKFVGAVTPINLNVALLAEDTSQLLISRYRKNLDSYGTDLLAQVGKGLLSAAIGEATQDEVIERIGHFFNGKEWELRRLVRTELHGVYNRGKLNSMEELSDDIPDLLKTLMHPMDSRTGEDSIYAAQKHLVAKMDEDFHYTWNEIERVFMVPPDRPNDRSVMVPYRREWGKIQGPAFIPGSFPKGLKDWALGLI
jgi:hypothetical protein